MSEEYIRSCTTVEDLEFYANNLGIQNERVVEEHRQLLRSREQVSSSFLIIMIGYQNRIHEIVTSL